MYKSTTVMELLNMVEEGVDFEFDIGPITGWTGYHKGDVVLCPDASVTLDRAIELEFCILDAENMFQGSVETGRAYLEAVSNLSILVAKAAKEGRIVSRPLPSRCPGGTENEDGTWVYEASDFDLKPRPGSEVYVIPGDKLWLRHESRYDSRKKATIVEIDILYGILSA